MDKAKVEEVIARMNAFTVTIPDWGVDYWEVGQSENWTCLNDACDYQYGRNDEQDLASIVGFAKTMEEYSWGERKSAFTIRCPKCSRLFWFHVTAGSIELAIDKCPNWPADMKPK